MQCAAWPVALFASIYINSHLQDGATPTTPYQFIPGMKAEEILPEEVPFEVIEAGFKAYDAAYRKANPQEVNA